MSASGSPYAAAWIQRAGDMKCAARSAAAHEMGKVLRFRCRYRFFVKT